MSATYVNGIMFLSSEDYDSSEVMDLSDAFEMCLSKGLTLHKTAWRRGYIHRGGKLTVNCLVVRIAVDTVLGMHYTLNHLTRRTIQLSITQISSRGIKNERRKRKSN